MIPRHHPSTTHNLSITAYIFNTPGISISSYSAPRTSRQSPHDARISPEHPPPPLTVRGCRDPALIDAPRLRRDVHVIRRSPVQQRWRGSPKAGGQRKAGSTTALGRIDRFKTNRPCSNAERCEWSMAMFEQCLGYRMGWHLARYSPTRRRPSQLHCTITTSPNSGVVGNVRSRHAESGSQHLTKSSYGTFCNEHGDYMSK